MSNELTEYKNLIRHHPARRYLQKVHGFNHRGRVTAVTLEFKLSTNWMDSPTYVTGIAVQNPADTPNRKVGEVVAIYNGLQQAKMFINQNKV